MADIPDSRSKRPTPSTKEAQKGMNLNALLKATPPYVKNKSRPVIIKKLTKPFTKGGNRAIQAFAYDTTPTSEEIHKVTIIGLDAQSNTKTKLKKKDIPPISQQKRVLVDCDCAWFLYYCEYALWVHGAAKIKRCNGEPPVTTNPQEFPLSCKHLYSLYRQIKENGL